MATQKKGVKTDVSELAEALADELEKRKGKESEEEGEGGLVDVLAEVLPDLAEMLDEKRKSRKDADGEDAELNEDDIAELAVDLADLLEEDKGEEEDEKGKSEEEDDDDEEKRRKKARGARPAQRKRARPPAPTQRKYSNVYMGGGAQNAPAGGFKSRLDALPEKKKTPFVYENFGRAVKCICIFGQGDPEKAAFYAAKSFSDQDMARAFKAQVATIPASGGYLVPEIYANEIIDLLYAQTLIFELGAQRVPMESGNLTIPKASAGVMGYFIGEDRDIPASEAKFGVLKLSAKKLATIVPLSNDLLRSTHFTTDQMVGSDITKRMALRLDFSALYGKGGDFEPRGLVSNKGVQTLDASTLDAMYASGGVLTSSLPAYAEGLVLHKNVDESGMGWGMNAPLEFFFKNIKSTTGDFIFLEEMNRGNLMGYPYKRSSLIPAKSDLTDLFFGNWRDMIVGEQGGLMVETFREGSYNISDGKSASAMTRDETVIRAIQLIDVGVRHDESFLRIKNVKVPAMA